jgi:anti-sigma regulatory factor (Ser/Thr protein kinase)
VRATLVDALVGGESGLRAAIECRDLFGEARDESIVRAFERVHEALQAHQGVMASVVHFDLSRRVAQIAGVGNIAVLVYPRDEAQPRSAGGVVPGVLGSAFRRARVSEISFDVGDLVLMQTSNVRGMLEPIELVGLDADRATDRVLTRFGQPGADTACVVVRGVDPRDAEDSATTAMSQRSGAFAIIELGRVVLRIESDAQVAAFEARRLSALVGLPKRAIWELSIAVAELASNAVRHGGGGVMVLFHDLDADELVIEVKDLGVRSSPTMRPGLGVGLEASRRMLDGLEINREYGPGMMIVARKKITS